MILRIKSGQGNYRYGCQVVVSSKCLDKTNAIQDRHLNVAHYKVRRARKYFLQCIGTIPRRDYVVSPTLKKLSQKLAARGVIFGDYDFGRVGVHLERQPVFPA